MSKTFSLSSRALDGWADIDITLSYDFDGTVLNIGDEVAVEISGAYGSKDSKNLKLIRLILSKSYAIENNGKTASAEVLRIDTDIAPRGAINYSGSFVVTHEIATALAASNEIIGSPSYSGLSIGFAVEGLYSSFYSVTQQEVAVFDPTFAPIYNLTPNNIADSTK